MSATSVSINKTTTTTNITGTTGSCTITEVSGYKLISPPANLTSGWWKHFHIFHCKHTNNFHNENSRRCEKEVNYNND